MEEAFTRTKEKAKLHTQGLEYLTNILGIFIAQIERALSQYEHLILK